MEKIKQFLSNAWAIIALVVTGVIGVLLFFLKAKNREINALKAKIDLAETQKQVDLIEVEIKERLNNKNLLQKEIQELNNTLTSIEQRRSEIAAKEGGKSDKDIEDFWNK